MEEIKIYENPMTEEERQFNIGKPLKMPNRYHLIDCLKELKYGRPFMSQEIIDEWINDLNKNLTKGSPFI